MKPLVLFSLLLASTGQSLAQAPVSGAGLVKFKPPALTRLEGFDEAHCTAVPPDLRVCKAISDQGKGQAITEEILLLRGGKVTSRQPANGSTASFAVLQADLDADGRTETIVVSHDTTGNGLGVRYYTLHIWRPPTQGSDQAPLTFSVEEFGDEGTFVRQAGSQQIHILATHWIRSDVLDKKPGTYLIGRWFRYDQGRLASVNRPMRVRRLLAGFQNERSKVFAEPLNHFRWKSPYAWLYASQGRDISVDPEASGTATVVLNGTITAVRRVPYKADPADADASDRTETVVDIQADTGERVSCVKGDEDEVRARFPKARAFHRYGLLAQRMTLPDGVGAEALFPQLVGTRVQIASHQGAEDQGPTWVVWLQPAR